MLARWAAYLQEYQYTAEHVQGKYNPADAPSRVVSAAEEAPNDLTLIREYLTTNQLPTGAIDRRRIKRKADNHFLQENALFRKKGKQIRKVLETSQDRDQALVQLHNENGHPGINNTFNALHRCFW